MSELGPFVREALERGCTRDEIGEALRLAGWRSEEIAAALALYAEIPFPIPVPRRKPSVSAREAFLYLVVFLTLYISAVGIGALGFLLVEYWLPDPVVEQYVNEEGTRSALRSALASVLIAFPLYLWMTAGLQRSYREDPTRRQSPVRKWLTYLTLFVAAIVIIVDLIVVVASVLGGELTVRFLLKVLIVGTIAGAIFGYYLWDLRHDEQETAAAPAAPDGRVRVFGRAVAAVVALLVGISLVVAGSPVRERLRRADQQRVEDLQSIAREVSNYWERHRAMPAALDDVRREPFHSIRSTVDVRTGQPYEYRPLTGADFELCAEFDTDTTTTRPAPRARDGFSGTSEFWRHPAGRHCFRLDAKRGGALLPEADRP